MDQYKSHKVVKASEIEKVEHAGIRHIAIITLTNGEVIETKDSFIARGTPTKGDFLVKYSDDYYSWSPRETFLQGYTPIVQFDIEAEIEKRGLTNIRITAEDIESVVIGEDYYVFPDSTVTVCCLTLRNGFNVIGKSACISKNNFDTEIGRVIAKKDAMSKVGDFEAYLTTDRIFYAAQENSFEETINEIVEEGIISHSNGGDAGIHETIEVSLTEKGIKDIDNKIGD